MGNQNLGFGLFFLKPYLVIGKTRQFVYVVVVLFVFWGRYIVITIQKQIIFSQPT